MEKKDYEIIKLDIGDSMVFDICRGTSKANYTEGKEYKILDKYEKDGKWFLEIKNDRNTRWGVCADNSYKRWVVNNIDIKMKRIIPYYIVGLEDKPYCNELKFIINRFLEQNKQYKLSVEILRDIKEFKNT